MSDELVTCSSCSQPVPRGTDERIPPFCPHCGQMLVLDDEPAREAVAPAVADELEEVKIKRVVRDRRAMLRTRGYYLALMVGAWVGGAQAIWSAWGQRSSGQGLMLIAYAMIALACVLLGWEMWRRAREMSARLSAMKMPEPQKPPDFTGLSDGSQHVRNLEQMQ